jgi:glucan phosphoethanolaminetransferase (alkaline phosphatase superfamily)
MAKNKRTGMTSRVMRDIQAGKVKMRSRVYFLALSAVSIAASLAATFTIAYVASIIIFWFRIQTSDTMAYGARRNLSDAIAAFPWWLVVLAGVLLLLAVWLIRHYGRMYRYRTSAVLVIILMCSLIVGFGLSYVKTLGSHGGASERHTPGTSEHRGLGRQR